jgi:D-glycero-D-manno-heptose 1,7-bisphosphate phosphatase
VRFVPVLFLDIDGTVRRGANDPGGRFVNHPDHVLVFPEARARMAAWRQHGGRVVGVSNQGGVPQGKVTLADMAAAMDETQAQTGGLFDLILACTHPLERDACWCRKPQPGLLVQGVAALERLHPDEFYPHHEMLMVGDRPEDHACAANAGIRFRWAADWRAGL